MKASQVNRGVASSLILGHLKAAGFVQNQGKDQEKRASGLDPKVKLGLRKEAESRVLETVAVQMYQDPILARMLESGFIKQAALLAEGRFSDCETLDKLASLGPQGIQKVASQGFERLGAV